MKRRFISLILILSLLLCCACAAPAAPAATAPEAAQVPADAVPAASEAPAVQGAMPPYALSVSIQELHEEITAEDGTVVMLVTGKFPNVEVDGKEAATTAIYNYFKKEYEDYLQDDDIREMVAYAQEDYAERGKEIPEMFPYEVDTSFTVSRADKVCASFIKDEYSFTGGAHPNAQREAVTFDTATGRVLEFEDIVNNEEAARAFVEQQLIKFLENGDFGVFDDYKESVKEILEDDTWYFDELGVCIIINEYIVAPHATGILEMTIPYAEFPQLKEAYSPVK